MVEWTPPIKRLTDRHFCFPLNSEDPRAVKAKMQSSYAAFVFPPDAHCLRRYPLLTPTLRKKAGATSSAPAAPYEKRSSRGCSRQR